MWSDRYYYLNIYHDAELSVDHSTGVLIDFLKTLPELTQKGNFTFTNSAEFPIYVSLSLFYARALGNWNDRDTDQQKTNLAVIVCAKDNEQNFEKLKYLFIKIAAFLNWQLVNERTDDGVEDDVIWAPEEEW